MELDYNLKKLGQLDLDQHFQVVFQVFPPFTDEHSLASTQMKKIERQKDRLRNH